MVIMEKAQRLSLTAQVEASLRSALIVGKLKPGSRLVTRTLAEQLGTSITPVREALLRLVSAGALDAAPAASFKVPGISLEQYQEITIIRKNLESLAVKNAVPALNPERIAELKRLCAVFIAAKHSGDVEQSLEANRSFRFTLYGYANMPTLMLLIEQLWVQIGPSFNYLYPQATEFAQGSHNYERLLTALEAGDSQASETLIIRAIDDGALLLGEHYFNR